MSGPIPRYCRYHRPIALPERLCCYCLSAPLPSVFARGAVKGGCMKRISVLVVVAIAVYAIALMSLAASRADDEAAPIFGIKIPPGYRDWKLISVAHEEGNLNDLRAVLGNEVAINAYREGKLPFPDGTIITRLAWTY